MTKCDPYGVQYTLNSHCCCRCCDLTLFCVYNSSTSFNISNIGGHAAIIYQYKWILFQIKFVIQAEYKSTFSSELSIKVLVACWRKSICFLFFFCGDLHWIWRIIVRYQIGSNISNFAMITSCVCVCVSGHLHRRGTLFRTILFEYRNNFRKIHMPT